MLPINWQSFKLTCEVNCRVWRDAFRLGQLCSWPDEVFLLLVSESQGRRGFGTVNAKLGSRSWSCFWPWNKNKLSLAYLICCLLWGKERFVSVQGAGSLWSPWTRGLLWPPFLFHLWCSFWLLGFGNNVRSLSLLVPLPPQTSQALAGGLHHSYHSLSGALGTRPLVSFPVPSTKENSDRLLAETAKVPVA